MCKFYGLRFVVSLGFTNETRFHVRDNYYCCDETMFLKKLRVDSQEYYLILRGIVPIFEKFIIGLRKIKNRNKIVYK